MKILLNSPFMKMSRSFIEEQEKFPPAQQQYNLARDRARRQIRSPQRYAHANIVSFALSVVEDIESQVPITYHEAIMSNESAQ